MQRSKTTSTKTFAIRTILFVNTLPRISVVTPNYNLAGFLEQTMQSVLAQNYPNLEYIVVDGGSTDGSVEIIRKYEAQLAYWTSRRDAGHFFAIQEGLQRSTGEIMAWLNSDDMYLPGSLSVVAEIFSQHPEVEWITSTWPVAWNEKGEAIWVGNLQGFSREAFFCGEYVPCGTPSPFSRGCIQQESTFWRRSLWERAGGHLDERFRRAADFELWARFFQYAGLQGVDALLGGFRFRRGQVTDQFAAEYAAECTAILRECGGSFIGRFEASYRSRYARWLQPLLRRLPAVARKEFLYEVSAWRHSLNGDW